MSNQDTSLFPIRKLRLNTCLTTFLIKHSIEHGAYINKGKGK